MYHVLNACFLAMRTTSRNLSPRSHPAPGIPHSSSVGPSIAMQQIDVEYFGHGFVVLLQYRWLTHKFLYNSAHAGATPW